MASNIIQVTLYKYLFIIVYIPNIVINDISVNIVNTFIIDCVVNIINCLHHKELESHQCTRVWIPLQCIVIYNHKYFNFHP